MEVIKKISELKKSIKETEQSVEDLILSLKAQQIKTENKEKQIIQLKEEIRNNIEKIDEIIEEYNADT